MIRLLFPCFLAAQAAAAPILFWYSEDSYQGRFLKEVVGQFNAVHRSQVQPESGFELQAALLSSLSLRQLPDVILAPSNYVGLAQPLQLSEVPADLLPADLDPDARRMVTVGSHAWGVPLLEGNQLLLFYNRRLVARPAASWTELRDQAAALKRRGIMPIGWNYEEPYFFLPFLSAFGGWPITGAAVTLDTQPMREALRFYKSLSSDGLIPRDCDSRCGRSRFYHGEFAYALAGEWTYREARSALGDQLGIASLPTINGRRMVSARACQALLFPRHSLERSGAELLRELARFLLGDDVQRRWLSAVQRMPANVRLASDWEIALGPARAIWIAQWKQSRDLPATVAMTTVWPAIRRGVRAYLWGAADERQASRLMQQIATSERKP